MSASIFLRVFIWIGCLVGFLYQTSFMRLLFFDYPFSMMLVEDVRRNLLFQVANVCLHRSGSDGNRRASMLSHGSPRQLYDMMSALRSVSFTGHRRRRSSVSTDCQYTYESVGLFSGPAAADAHAEEEGSTTPALAHVLRWSPGVAAGDTAI
ncbi:hypothetical protein HPB49_013815 [Dermacentor silvarum]|uniref:Uncharacterized protein n=1 Tax=Dermacentor silvarum TaxID=543639 RepID=A0ACB8E108_DERSI|nr:hypothetical protein HPB49_013815 [Dermacentor silvarum]